MITGTVHLQGAGVAAGNNPAGKGPGLFFWPRIALFTVGDSQYVKDMRYTLYVGENPELETTVRTLHELNLVRVEEF